MRRYIDANELKEFYKPYAERKLSVPVDVVLLNIDDMQTEDVQEVRHGRWDGDSCSVCWFSWCDVTYDIPQMQMPYCPNCGARMDLASEDE